MTELMPCPFCGGKAYLDSFEDTDFLVTCDNCYGSYGWVHTEKEATDGWNGRYREVAKISEKAYILSQIATAEQFIADTDPKEVINLMSWQGHKKALKKKLKQLEEEAK